MYAYIYMYVSIYVYIYTYIYIYVCFEGTLLSGHGQTPSISSIFGPTSPDLRPRLRAAGDLVAAVQVPGWRGSEFDGVILFDRGLFQLPTFSLFAFVYFPCWF